MSPTPNKQKIEKLKDSTKETAKPHTKEEPARGGDSGGMLGEGEPRESTDGGMKGEN